MEVVWDKEQTKLDIANDVYLGYERDAANKLYPKLPKGREDFEDLLAWMRLHAIEAAELYKVPSKAQFSTFLYKHLQIRSLQWFNWVWLPKVQPQTWQHRFSELQGEEDSPNFEIADMSTRPSLRAELNELLSLLTERSKQLLSWLFDIANDAEYQEDLFSSFRSGRLFEFCSYAGIEKAEAASLFAEVKKHAPSCVRSV